SRRARDGLDGGRPRPPQPVQPEPRARRRALGRGGLKGVNVHAGHNDGGNMTVKEQPRRTWRRPGRLAVILLVIGLVSAAVAAASSGALTRGKSSKPTIVLADNSWEGSTANDIVAQYVIQK